MSERDYACDLESQLIDRFAGHVNQEQIIGIIEKALIDARNRGLKDASHVRYMYNQIKRREDKLVATLQFYAIPWGTDFGQTDKMNLVIQEILNAKCERATRLLTELGYGKDQ